MGRKRGNYENLTVDEQIIKEVKNLSPLIKNLDKERKQIAENVIAQLAFVQVTLDRLTQAVNSGEIMEDFVQGKQTFKRGNTALKDYNSTIKSYISLSKQLCELLPNDEKERAGEELMSFITGGRAKNA